MIELEVPARKIKLSVPLAVSLSERSLGRQVVGAGRIRVMKSKSRKLALHPETLKKLEPQAVRFAKGGVDNQEESPTGLPCSIATGPFRCPQP